MPDRRGLALERLRKRADFLALRNGPRHSTPHFTVQVSAASSVRPSLRAGLTVTKKVGNAVERNRIKRRLRSLLSNAARDLDPAIWAGHDMAVIARREALDADHADLQHSLSEALRRIARRLTKP